MLPEHGFLFEQTDIGQWNGFLPQRPAILIHPVQGIKAAVAQELANGDVHEVDFFFLAEILLRQSPQLPNTNQKQDGIQIGLLTELFFQPGDYLIPAFPGFLFHKRESKACKAIPGPVLIFS